MGSPAAYSMALYPNRSTMKCTVSNYKYKKKTKPTARVPYRGIPTASYN